MSKCPSLCFLHLPAQRTAEPRPRESWKAQLSMDFAEIGGYITRKMNAEWKFHFGRFFMLMVGDKKMIAKTFLKCRTVFGYEILKKRKRKEGNKIREGR